MNDKMRVVSVGRRRSMDRVLFATCVALLDERFEYLGPDEVGAIAVAIAKELDENGYVLTRQVSGVDK